MTKRSAKPSKSTIARTVALAVALISQIVVMYGGEALPFSQDQVYKAASTVLTVVAAVYAWWKNNSFSDAAIEADTFLDMVRNETKTYEK